jgi:hypothetical protein
MSKHKVKTLQKEIFLLSEKQSDNKKLGFVSVRAKPRLSHP